MADHLIQRLGFDEITMERVLNFLPYPFLVSEWREGAQRNLFLNQKFHQEIGYSLDDIPTISDWFRLAYPDITYQQEVIKKWYKKSEQAKRLHRDSILMKAKIHTRHRGDQWYQVKASISGNVNLVAFINIHDDVMKELELERQNENNNQALSILTHDLRGPLHNLMAILKLGGQGAITQEEFAHSLNSLSGSMFKLIEFFDTTLQWTRSNFNRVNTSFEQIDLDKNLRAILEVYQAQYQEKNISISLDVAAVPNIWTDPEIVSIVSRNIISNAIKFTEQNGHIHITAKREASRTTISFRDTGIGISPERIEMIVNKNYTSERGTAGEKGLGLGLQLCNQLLHKIGARLEIESVIAKGTTVKIVL